MKMTKKRLAFFLLHVIFSAVVPLVFGILKKHFVIPDHRAIPHFV